MADRQDIARSGPRTPGGRGRRLAAALLAGLVAAVLSGPARAQVPAEPATLTMFTTIQKENLRRFKEGFEADNPDIRLVIRTLSNGTVTDALLAQEQVGDVDVIWGLSAASMILLRELGLLLPHGPAGAESVLTHFKDGGDPPAWVGGGVWTTAVCAAAGLGERTPASWDDLTDRDWRRRIVAPSPVTSGAGLALVAGWISAMGEAAAWDFMDALHENVLLYTQDSNRPCRMAASGAADLGLSYDFRAYTTQAQGGAVTPVFPAGLGWDVSAFAILAGTDVPAAARRFADWSSSARARRLYADEMNFSIIASGEVSGHLTHLPGDLLDRLAPIDFAWLAANRERILAQWLRRYGTKLEAPTAP